MHFVLYAASNEQYRKAYVFFFRQVLCMGSRKRVSDQTIAYSDIGHNDIGHSDTWIQCYLVTVTLF